MHLSDLVEYSKHRDVEEAAKKAAEESVDKLSNETKVGWIGYNPLGGQVGGGHYKDRGIQPIEYTSSNHLTFNQGNVVKYITRYKDKKGIEDLAKAIHYVLLESYFQYGIKGSTELKDRVLAMFEEGVEHIHE